ncbi:MAG: hypothetical protein ABI615_02035 [Chthoniobacterales bacterium]
MDTPLTDIAPAPFKDRMVGLVIFGILTILLGLICLVLVGFMTFAMSLAAKSSPGVINWQTQSMVMGIYGSIAGINIWLGIGSIMARRWARAVLLILSWSWLVMGIFMTVGMCFIFNHMTDAMMMGSQASVMTPVSAKTIVLSTMAFISAIFIFIPLIWVLFYGGKNVKATCESRDPVIRWTDRCPLPVIAASLWLFFSGLCMLLMPFAYGGVLPFFGMILSGVPGGIIYIILAIVFFYCSYAFYRLDLKGWWIKVIILILFGISNALTYTRHSMTEMAAIMYRDLPADQLKIIQDSTWMNNNTMVWMGTVNVLVMLGYLLYIRKFFPKKVV